MWQRGVRVGVRMRASEHLLDDVVVIVVVVALGVQRVHECVHDARQAAHLTHLPIEVRGSSDSAHRERVLCGVCRDAGTCRAA